MVSPHSPRRHHHPVTLHRGRVTRSRLPKRHTGRYSTPIQLLLQPVRRQHQSSQQLLMKHARLRTQHVTGTLRTPTGNNLQPGCVLLPIPRQDNIVVAGLTRARKLTGHRLNSIRRAHHPVSPSLPRQDLTQHRGTLNRGADTKIIRAFYGRHITHQTRHLSPIILGQHTIKPFTHNTHNKPLIFSRIFANPAHPQPNQPHGEPTTPTDYPHNPQLSESPSSNHPQANHTPHQSAEQSPQ